MQPRAVATGGAGLHARAAAKGLAFGTAITAGQLRDPALAALVRAECGVLVPEYQQKWDRLEWRRGVLDAAAADQIADFARDSGLRLRGHALVWHEAIPAWALELDARGLGAAMEAHVAAAAARWRGRIATWDVVNEAIRPEDGRLDWLRRTPFLERLGPDYLPSAFRLARAADPAARLAYNDFGCEHATVAARRKRMGVLSLLRALRANGAPLGVLGMQAHLHAHLPFEADEWRGFLADVAELGLAIEITELDVNDARLPADTAARDAAVADLTRRFLEATLAERAVTTVVTWGLSDRHSWIRAGRLPLHRRTDRATSRPLPFDEELRRKPMWGAIAAAFDSAPAR